MIYEENSVVLDSYDVLCHKLGLTHKYPEGTNGLLLEALILSKGTLPCVMIIIKNHITNKWMISIKDLNGNVVYNSNKIVNLMYNANTYDCSDDKLNYIDLILKSTDGKTDFNVSILEIVSSGHFIKEFSND